DVIPLSRSKSGWRWNIPSPGSALIRRAKWTRGDLITRRKTPHSEKLGGEQMNSLWQDLRYGARMLGKAPGLTVIALLSTAIGIGANTAIFSLVDKLLLQNLPVKEPERLALLSAESVNPRFKMNVFSWRDFKDYREQNQVFSDLIASGPRFAGLGAGAELEEVACELVSENYFSALGVRLVKGRSFTAEENSAPGASA